MARILYLIDGLYGGGAERQLSLLLKYMPAEWETKVVSLSNGPYYQVLLDQKTPVVVHQRRSRFDLIPIFQLYSEIIRFRPDIIHSWGWLSSALVAPICKVLRILLIDGTLRVGGVVKRNYLRSRLTFILSDHIIANSHAALSVNRIPAAKSSTVYNGIDPERLVLFNQKSTANSGITTVIMTGRISSDKDFPSFFEAARRLSSQESGRWKFIAVGAGEDKVRKDFIKKAEDLVASGVMEFPNAGLEVTPFLKKANIGVLLSPLNFQEGFSNSIMEYMACQLPVICSESGGNRELVVDGETGFIIPPENVDMLIKKLTFLRDHIEISDRIGKAGYHKVMSMCSIDRMISEYEVIYTMLLSKRYKGNPEIKQIWKLK